MRFNFSIPRKVDVCTALIVLYFAVILIFGRSNSLMGALSWGIALLWMGLAFSHIQKMVPNLAVTTFFLVGVIFYIALWDLGKYGLVSFVSTFFRYFTMFLPFYMCIYMYGRDYDCIKKHLKFCLILYTALSIAQCVLYITADDPEYARNVVGTDWGYFTFIADAYGLCQAAAFLAIVGFMYFFKKGGRLETIAFFILNNVIIVLTKSTLIILCYAVALSFLIADKMLEWSFIGSIKGKLSKAMVKIIVYIAAFIIVYNVISWLGGVFIQFAEGKGGVVASRFRELGYLLTANNQSNDISARFSAYTTSITTALKHPILGNYSAYDIGSYKVIGGHSEIIDMAARYGFPIMIIFFGFVYYFVNKETKLAGIRIPGLLMLYFLFIIVNPFNYSIAYFSLLYLAPLLGYVKENEDGIKSIDYVYEC